MQFLSDLFKNVGNKAWDLARILSAIAFFAVIALAAYRAYLGQEVGLRDLSGALMDVLIGAGLVIGAKDLAGAHTVTKTI